MKNIKKILLTLILVIFTTGCVKYNVEMEVKDDKSVTLEILYGMKIDSSLMQNNDSNDGYNFADPSAPSSDDEISSDFDTTIDNANSISAEDYAFLEKAGFKVENYKETSQEGNVIEGVKVSKTFSNINDITSNNKISVDFNSLFDEENKEKLDDIKLFYKDGSKYVANYIFNFEDDSGMDYSSYSSMFDLSYKIRLPKESVSNNATKLSEDKKELIWNLEYGKKNYVNYEFKLGTEINFVLIGGIAAIIIIIVLIIVVSSKARKNNNENKVYDSILPGENNNMKPIQNNVVGSQQNNNLTSINTSFFKDDNADQMNKSVNSQELQTTSNVLYPEIKIENQEDNAVSKESFIPKEEVVENTSFEQNTEPTISAFNQKPIFDENNNEMPLTNNKNE